MLKRTLELLRPVCILSSLIITSTTHAAGRTFWLNVVNKDEVAISVTIAQINCYEPEIRGQHGTKFTLQPNGVYGFWINRVQGNDCDGEQGEFKLIFSPEPDDKINTLTRNETYFDFDNKMNLTVNHNNHPNQYPGTLIKTASDKYQYQTSRQLKRPEFDKPTGKNKAYWEMVCSSACTLSNSVTVTKGSSTETVKNTEETDAISKSLTIGVELPYGISVEASTSTENSKTQGQSFSTAMSEEKSTTQESAISYTPDDFKRFGIGRIWQWVAEVPMQSGKSVKIRSLNYTCTPGNRPPTYLPNSDKDVRTCSTEVEQEMSEKEATDLRIAKLNEIKMQRELNLPSQPAANTTATQTQLNDVPNNGPIRIASPSHWHVDQTNNLFDVMLAASGSEAAMLFKFANISTLAQELKTVETALTEDIGTLTPNGKNGKTQINGMPAEYAEYTALKNGHKLDVGVIVIQASQTKAALLFTIVQSDKAQQYQDTIGQILASIKAK